MSKKNPRVSAGELSKKAMSDTTKYDALEVGHAISDDISKHLHESLELHFNEQDEEGNYPWRELDQFCVGFVIASDPLIANLQRRKFFCCPFLPSPRPNQSIFLYTKRSGRITKRLWVLPSDMVMAELASLAVVDKRYKTMQAWAVAFFEGRFWEYIRFEHGIDMLSQEEFMSQHRKELIEAGCKLLDPVYTNPFNFDKINIEKIIDTQEALV